jgi:V/A-type H+/Na+-transporting ATPase subunit A
VSTQNPSSGYVAEESRSGGPARARVLGVNGNIVRIEVQSGPIMKNEVAFVRVGDERLKSEVLRVYGNIADLQVFEETDGVRFGDRVELTGQMLSLTLGPGMLGVIYDGLQNPLVNLAQQDGFFLKRGRDLYPLDSRQNR